MSSGKFISDDISKYGDGQWWDDEYKKCNPEEFYDWFANQTDSHFFETLISTIPNTNVKIF